MENNKLSDIQKLNIVLQNNINKLLEKSSEEVNNYIKEYCKRVIEDCEQRELDWNNNVITEFVRQ